MTTLCKTFILVLSLTFPCFAAGGAGTTGSAFLKIPVSARVTGIGGALGADTGDAAAIDYNPAALAGLDRTDIQPTYINYFDDTSLQSVTVGFPVSFRPSPLLEPLDGAEFPQNKLAVGIQYRQFRAEDTARDSIGVKLENFDIRDQLVSLAVAYPVVPKLSVGLTGKMIGNKIQNKSVSTYGFDGGVLGKFSSRWSAGLSVQNLGSAKALDKQADPLPTLTRASLSYRLPGWLLVSDLSMGRDGVVRESGGVEWLLNRVLRVRGGAYHDTSFQLTGGLGVRITGPQKASRAPLAPVRSKRTEAAEPAASEVAQQLLSHSVEKLTKQFIEAGTGMEKPTLAVLPLKSSGKKSQPINEILAREFKRNPEFQTGAAADASNSDVVLLGEVERAGDKYKINTRLVRMDDGKSIAVNYVEIAVEEFENRSKPLALDAPAGEKNSRQPDYSHVDIGLDYGLATSKDLGLTHTITVRILY